MPSTHIESGAIYFTNDLNLLAGVEFGAIGGFCQRWATTQCPYTVRGGISKTATGLHQSWPPEPAHMSSTCWVGVFWRIRLSMFDVRHPKSLLQFKSESHGISFSLAPNWCGRTDLYQELSFFSCCPSRYTDREVPLKKTKQKSLGVTWPLTHATFLFKKIQLVQVATSHGRELKGVPFRYLMSFQNLALFQLGILGECCKSSSKTRRGAQMF